MQCSRAVHLQDAVEDGGEGAGRQGDHHRGGARRRARQGGALQGGLHAVSVDVAGGAGVLGHHQPRGQPRHRRHVHLEGAQALHSQGRPPSHVAGSLASARPERPGLHTGDAPTGWKEVRKGSQEGHVRRERSRHHHVACQMLCSSAACTLYSSASCSLSAGAQPSAACTAVGGI